MSYEEIRIEREEHIVRLTFARPEKANSMTPSMGREIRRAAEEIGSYEGARVLIVTGEGNCFSAGGDFGILEGNVGKSPGETEPMMIEYYKNYLSLHRLPLPTIASVNGAAIGAGCCFAMACDVRVASSEATFGMTFTKLGLHPGMGGTYFLPRLVGPSKAKELCFTGRIISAEEALDIGLVDKVTSVGELEGETLKLAREVADSGPLANRLIKEVLNRSSSMSLDEVLLYESASQAECFVTKDYEEGVKAVIGRRKPLFKGL